MEPDDYAGFEYAMLSLAAIPVSQVTLPESLAARTLVEAATHVTRYSPPPPPDNVREPGSSSESPTSQPSRSASENRQPRHIRIRQTT